MIHPILVRRSASAFLLCVPYTQAALFSLLAFVSWQLRGDSSCLQVNGGAKRGSWVRNELTHGPTEKHLSGLRTHTAANPTRMVTHYQTPPTASPLCGCHLTLDRFTLAVLESLARSEAKTGHLTAQVSDLFLCEQEINFPPWSGSFCPKMELVLPKCCF